MNSATLVTISRLSNLGEFPSSLHKHLYMHASVSLCVYAFVLVSTLVWLTICTRGNSQLCQTSVCIYTRDHAPQKYIPEIAI